MTFGQNTKKGDKAFDNGDYYQAIEEYSMLVDNMDDAATRSLLRYRIAESYRRMNRPEKAEKYYVDAIKAGYMSPEVYFGYGDILLKLGKYEDAKSAFETYKRSSPGDRLVDAKIASCIYAQANPLTNPHFTLQPLETLNSRGSEYGIAYFNDALIYASTRNPIEEGDSKESRKISLRTGLPYSKMYMSVPINGLYSTGEEVVGLNRVSQTNEGTFTYDPRTKLGYYTRCDAGDQCYVYYAEFKGNKWVEKNRLPIDGRKQPVGHPCFTPDGNRLYFISAMEGGYGKSDIWYMDKLPDNKWSKPINVGREVNSVGNEFFPFVMDGYLFFASDGHPGYGGLDIYASKIEGNAHGPAYNIGMPFNSSQDDFNLIERLDLSEGMMVSTRRGEKSNDDIFRYNGFPHSLIASGKVYDSISLQPLPNATVEIIRGGKVKETLTVTDSGTFMFYALPDTLYQLKASLLAYTSKSIDVKTSQERFGHIDNLDIPLNSTEAFISGLVYNKETGAPLSGIPVVLYENNKQIAVITSDANGIYKFGDIKQNTTYVVKAAHKEYFTEIKTKNVGRIDRSIVYSKATSGDDMDLPLEKIVLNKQVTIENILYDYNKATLRPESLVELDKLVTYLNQSPQLKLQISSHTDARGSAKTNNTLSEKRAKSVVDYLLSRGISPARLTWKGYGKSDLLIKKAKTEAEHQLNRRTTFMVTGLMDTPLFDTTGGTATVTVPVTGGGLSEGMQTPTTTPGSTATMPSSGTYSNPNAPFVIQVGAGATLNLNNPNFQRLATQLNLQVFYEQGADRLYRYFVGGYNTRNEAEAMASRIKALGIDCFVKAK
jgi:outer membrane protein OmpA-like peptidoglycan-associated protein